MPLSTGVAAPVKMFVPEQETLKAIIYGISGAGKTTVALSASKSTDMSPVLVINTDYGLSGAMHIENVRVLNLQTWKNLDWVITELLKPNDKRDEMLRDIRTVVIDSISALRDFVLAEIASEAAIKNTRPDQYTNQLQDYNRALIIITQFIARLRQVNVNLIMTAAVDKEVSGELVTLAYPDLFPKLRNQLNYMVDMIWPVEKKAGKYFIMVADSTQTTYLQKTRNAKFQALLAERTEKGWFTVPSADYETLPMLYDLRKQALKSS